jgi:hypothetical protein
MLANKNRIQGNRIQGTAEIHDPTDLHRSARSDFLLLADALFTEKNTRCLTRRSRGVASSIHCRLPGSSGVHG